MFENFLFYFFFVFSKSATNFPDRFLNFFVVLKNIANPGSWPQTLGTPTGKTPGTRQVTETKNNTQLPEGNGNTRRTRSGTLEPTYHAPANPDPGGPALTMREQQQQTNIACDGEVGFV